MKLTQTDRRSLLEELTSKGVRLTAQHRVLNETMEEAKERLYVSSMLSLARKRKPSIDRATVYRTIERLKRLGLADELDLMQMNGEKHYYEVRPKKDYAHLACLECGQIEEFSSPLFEQVKSEIAARTSFEIWLTRLEVGGRCSTCRNKNEEREVA
jgi:Fur family ferric uptake transcriptional regulator